jgi:hypothetical protein
MYSTASAPKSIWVSRIRSCGVETRLIIAYSLIAVMAVLAIIGVVAIQRNRARTRLRDSGQGSKM